MVKMVVDRDVEVPMRDGTVLRADVYRIKNGPPAPALIQRIPYRKEEGFVIPPFRAVEAGYVVVSQDTRGRYQSDGTFVPFAHEIDDGYDTVEWVAAQPWCDGNVGMTGGSYYGATQWLAAAARPPHLRAIAPLHTSSDLYTNWFYQGGAFELSFTLMWTLMLLAPDYLSKLAKAGTVEPVELRELERLLEQLEDLYKFRPLSGIPLVKRRLPWYGEWLGHPLQSGYWRKISPQTYHDRIDIPVYNIGGWYDIFLRGTIENFAGIGRRRPPGSRDNHLIIGPWAHGFMWGVYPQIDYGKLASDIAIDLPGKLLNFFDRWMKPAGAAKETPPVELFVMGENRWRQFESWPPDADLTPYYLHSEGQANTSRGNGTLSTVHPGDEPSDAYLFDPNHPVPTIGGQTFAQGPMIAAQSGPADQTPIEQRHDVLCYTSDVLTEPVTVVGPVKARIYASSSAKDTDWVVKLIDVFPDGRALLLTEGVLRARYRESFENPRLLEPGEVYEFEIDMWATGNTFLPGHRIRIDVTSSNFPRFDVNTNTGGILAEEDGKNAVRAVNTIYHNSKFPSHVLLPVLRRY